MRTSATGPLTEAPSLRSALAARASLALSRGFTLVELLVVVVIIGVIVSAVTLAIGVLGPDREVEEQSRRFWAVLQQAREESELQGLDVGVFVGRTEYEYLRFDQRRNQWVPLLDDKLYAPRELPEGLRFRLWLEAREIVLKPALPNREDEDEHKKWPPQVMVLSSGDIMPFELHIERDDQAALFRVVGLADNDLRIERRATDSARSANRDWVMIQQTKPPPDEDERNKPRRMSNAR
jgi:general secretion pathway protein H